MIYAREVHPSSQYENGTLMYPGVWVEVWFVDPSPGVHWLLAFQPKQGDAT